MPTYVYEIIDEGGAAGERFEVFQRMADPPLTTDPQTGRPVRRVPVAPHIAGQWSESATRSKLSDRNLERLGFAKYQNTGDGSFEKRAGQGPDRLGGG